MGIQITSQLNEQECGVCALTSLHNYFYRHEPLKKEQVLNKSNIEENGMTLFDFEVLGNKLGLECESYEVNWSEFVNLRINGYFVLLLSTTNNTNHYVIAHKTKKSIEIIDSCSSQPKTIKYDELKLMFLNVVILINKKPGKLFDKTFGKSRTLLLFDAKFVLLNLLFSLLILCTSVGCASFLNWIIDIAVAKSSINNLISIGFAFLLIYFLNDLFLYISELYSANQTKTYLILFTSKILNNISYKKFDFLNKIDQNWVYKIDECVYNISNFCVVQVNKLITNIIFCFICICIIGSICYWLLIFCVLFAAVEIVFFIFRYRKKKEVFLSIVRSENKNTIYYKQLIRSLSNEIWINKKKHLIHRIKENYSSIYKNFNDVNLFKSNASLFKSLFKGFIEIAMIVVMGYFIITSEKLSIGNMTFLLATFSLFKSSMSDICEYFIIKQEFDIYWQVYKDITSVGNTFEDKKIMFKEEIKSIAFFIENKKIVLNSNKTNEISYSGYDLFSKSSSIHINNKKISENKHAIQDVFVLLDENSKIESTHLLELFENNINLFSQYIRYFDLDLNKESQSFYDCIILNLLVLLTEKDKVVVIDSLLDNIKAKDKLVVKEIINKIRKENAVFILRKEEND